MIKEYLKYSYLFPDEIEENLNSLILGCDYNKLLNLTAMLIQENSEINVFDFANKYLEAKYFKDEFIQRLNQNLGEERILTLAPINIITSYRVYEKLIELTSSEYEPNIDDDECLVRYFTYYWLIAEQESNSSDKLSQQLKFKDYTPFPPATIRI